MTFLKSLIESEQSLKNFEAEYRKNLRVAKEAENPAEKPTIQQPQKFEFGKIPKQIIKQQSRGNQKRNIAILD
jgi:hypothetical protein